MHLVNLYPHWMVTMNEVVLQSILGTDKRNPYLHVLRRKDTDKLEVYYGAQRLETVVDDKDHINMGPVWAGSTMRD